MPLTRCLNRGDEALVRTVHVTNPHDFYVRFIDDDDWISCFQQLVEEHSALSVQKSPKLGQLVFVNHKQHGWARAIITDDKNGKYTVRTLDYGDVLHNVFPAQLFRLDWGDATAAKAMHCKLYLCEPVNGKKWSPSSINTFINYMGKNALKMTVMNRMPGTGQLVVELNSGWPETVSKMMVMAQAACFGNPNQQVNPLTPYLPVITANKQNYLHDTLEFGKQIEVQILNVHGEEFDVVKVERNEAFQSVDKLLEAEFEGYERLRKIEFAVGTPVVCKLERRTLDRYFRGEITNAQLDCGNVKVTVKLVDIGEKERVLNSKNALRKCAPSLLEEPVFAISCVLTENQQNLRGRLAPGLRFGVTAVKKAETKDCYVVLIDVNSLPKV